MNIGLYCNAPAWGGLEMIIPRLAKWFAEARHQIVIFIHFRPLRADTPLAFAALVELYEN